MTANRRILLNIIVTYGRSLYALVCGLVASRCVLVSLCWGVLAGSVVAADKETPSAWRNCVGKTAAEEAMCAYTSNVIKCEWAGEDPKIARQMPANLGFQFAVIGDSDVTNRVQKILNDVADSLNPELRKNLENWVAD